MVKLITVVAVLAVHLSILVTPATASHLSAYIYSPYTGQDWIFTRGEHPANEKRLASAHDVSWASTPSSIVFNVSGGVVGEVLTVANNCLALETWDQYVTLQLSVNGEFYGTVSYVHITNPTVTQGQLISAGTSLGSPQTQTSNCWQGVHVHMERSSNGEWGGNDVIGQWFPYSTWVIRMWNTHLQRPEPLSGTQTN